MTLIQLGHFTFKNVPFTLTTFHYTHHQFYLFKQAVEQAECVLVQLVVPRLGECGLVNEGTQLMGNLTHSLVHTAL